MYILFLRQNAFNVQGPLQPGTDQASEGLAKVELFGILMIAQSRSVDWQVAPRPLVEIVPPHRWEEFGINKAWGTKTAVPHLRRPAPRSILNCQKLLPNFPKRSERYSYQPEIMMFFGKSKSPSADQAGGDPNSAHVITYDHLLGISFVTQDSQMENRNEAPVNKRSSASTQLSSSTSISKKSLGVSENSSLGETHYSPKKSPSGFPFAKWRKSKAASISIS